MGVERMNQHSSNKLELMRMLDTARFYLRNGCLLEARITLSGFWGAYAQMSASTRRRWKCGK